MKALVIDDSARMRTELKALLVRLGWTVIGEGENGLEALELARTLKPDLITLDIIMPEMDGIETYRHLRQLDPNPRVLLVSVLAAEPRVIKAYEKEIYGSHFLKKPVTEKDLRDKIDLVMNMPPMPQPPSMELGEGELPPLPPQIPG